MLFHFLTAQVSSIHVGLRSPPMTRSTRVLAPNVLTTIFNTHLLIA
ncbi:hypothetical protein [Calothrix sp. PCC 6303]|nr:hypothetical protein [Calothrix sp. PCC 6303]